MQTNSTDQIEHDNEQHDDTGDIASKQWCKDRKHDEARRGNLKQTTFAKAVLLRVQFA
jgi:hypothetical protein